MPQWLNNSVFYQVYPQSFYDSNGDGIGEGMSYDISPSLSD